MWKQTEKLENLPQTMQEVAEPRTQLPDLKVSNCNRYNCLLLRQRVDEKTEYQRGKVTCQGCTTNEWFWTTYPLGASIKAAMKLSDSVGCLSLWEPAALSFWSSLSLIHFSTLQLCTQWPLAVPTHSVPSPKHRIFPIKEVLWKNVPQAQKDFPKELSNIPRIVCALSTTWL